MVKRNLFQIKNFMTVAVDVHIKQIVVLQYGIVWMAGRYQSPRSNPMVVLMARSCRPINEFVENLIFFIIILLLPYDAII